MPRRAAPTVLAKAPPDGEPERARVEGDRRLQLGHVDVDQEVHARSIRRYYGMRARLHPTVSSQVLAGATSGGPVSTETAEL